MQNSLKTQINSN